MASGIVKKCYICGRIYDAYNVADTAETELEGNPVTEDDVLGEDLDFVVFETDSQHPSTDPLPNGLQLLTISERMDIQDAESAMDLCPTCLAAIQNKIEELGGN